MFFGKIVENEFVTVEKYISGTFQKYVDNDGTIVNGIETSADDLKKVDAFVYYAYKKSEGNLMVLDIMKLLTLTINIKLLTLYVDIQGISNILCDPEIATKNIGDIGMTFYFV